MKIASVIALCRSPLFEDTIHQCVRLSDGVVIRFDAKNGDPAILQAAQSLCGDKLIKTIICDGWPIVPQWREEGLRALDEFKPDIVLCPDEDEVFAADDDSFKEELKAFWFSEKKGMMFSYNPLVTKDNRIVNNGVPYPPDPHMKAYKWAEGLSYYPYHGNAIIAKYCNSASHWNAHCKIDHYCCWTLAMEKSKHWKSNTPNFKGIKAVTLIAFGPSADQDMSARGEVWSLNNCYEVLPKAALDRCTRVFEMHKFGERSGGNWDKCAKFLGKDKLDDRNKMISGDGRTHVERLNEMAMQGRRVIMQEPHPMILNSERYPIEEVVKTTGVDWFMGSPCYLVALAIVEGYTHISLYGLDQMDWEHTIQRENFVGWVMYAIGRGIVVDGALTFLKDIDRRYGYDFGPEFDEWCEDKLWQGHPLKIHYKIPSRVVEGEMCRKLGG